MNHCPTQSRDTSNDSSTKYVKVSSFVELRELRETENSSQKIYRRYLAVTAFNPQVWQWPNPRKVIQKRNMASLFAKGCFFHAFAVSDGPKSRAVGTVSWFFTLILSSACRKFWKWWINNRNWSNGITEGFSTNDPGLSVRWDGQPLDEAFWPWFVVRSWGMVSL